MSFLFFWIRALVIGCRVYELWSSVFGTTGDMKGLGFVQGILSSIVLFVRVLVHGYVSSFYGPEMAKEISKIDLVFLAGLVQVFSRLGFTISGFFWKSF